tara:strand:+ start:22277 stop:22954 length:678 start_codon:yes stop_codon:yes gene_type:complete
MSDNFEDMVKSKNSPSVLDIETERRLTRSEQSIEDLDGNLKSLELRVDSGFKTVDTDLRIVRSELATSHNVIIEKINNLQVSEINDKKTSWPLIISVIGLIFGVTLTFVGWGMSQQKTSAVNEAVATVHYKYQTAENERNIDWNRRQNDRGISRDKELALIQKNYFEHGEGLELEAKVDDAFKDLAKVDTILATLSEYDKGSEKRLEYIESELKDARSQKGWISE